jgi:hypothetical protein
MAKKELFNNKWFGKFLSSLNAFPVDREVLFSFNNLMGFFSVLGPGFSLSTGNALREDKNLPNHLLY